jgi:hypothetical protein
MLSGFSPDLGISPLRSGIPPVVDVVCHVKFDILGD